MWGRAVHPDKRSRNAVLKSGIVLVPMLPPELQTAVQTAFGNANAHAIAPLQGGKSGATVFAFEIDGKPWVIRRGEPRAAVTARIASDLGVAPHVHFADETNGIVIMERVDGVPFGGCRDRDLIARVAKALRTVHDGPPFPASIETNAFFGKVNEMYKARAGVDLPLRIHELWNECTELCAHFPTAPCHRDLNPGNVLTTPERVCILDWDTAGAADPFLDLSLLGVFGVVVPADREFLLEAYLGRAPTELEKARQTVGRVHALAFYAVSFHFVAAMTGQLHAAEPVPMTQLREHINDPIVVGVSLLAEAERWRAESSFASAAQSCAGSRSRSDASTRS